MARGLSAVLLQRQHGVPGGRRVDCDYDYEQERSDL